jgi:galactokinase
MRELAAQDGVAPDAGARVAIAHDASSRAGLGSSAALTVATARALARMLGVDLAPRALAGVAYRAGHDHAGVPRGVMDPLIAALGREDHALLIECATLASHPITCRAAFLLVDTGVRDDATSRLLERRAECQEALRMLRVELPELLWLARWPVAWLARLKKALPAPLRDRAAHVVAESARARFAAELLAARRWTEFGRLLFESHESCRRLFGGSTPELDAIVAAAKRAGALGARLTDAGSGGTVLVLTRRDPRARARVTGAIGRAVRKAFGRDPSWEWVRAAGGVHVERV